MESKAGECSESVSASTRPPRRTTWCGAGFWISKVTDSRLTSSFMFEGMRWRLCWRKDVPRSDVVNGCVTLTRESDDEEVVIRASDFVRPVDPRSRLPEHSKRVHFRDLIERMLELGFDDRWCGIIGRFVRDQRLLEPGMRNAP